MRFAIVINRLFDIEGNCLTIGGIQTYLINLSKVIHENYGTRPTIYQAAKRDFFLRLDHCDVRGLGNGTGRFNSKALVRRITKFEKPGTLLIWGSDQYSHRQRFFRSINIQHGIGFDVEATETAFKRTFVKYKAGWFYKLLQRRRALSLSRNGDITVCVDYNFPNWARTFSVTEAEKARLKVIPNFTSSITPVPRKSETTRVLIARRFVRRRGIGIALSAVEALLGKFSNIHFTFAGDGPDKEQIETLRKMHPNRIEITKYAPEKSLEFHSKFDVAIIPSIGSEGTSLSLLEAMGAGCFPIATNVGGLTNILIDRFNGLIVEPNSLAIVEAVTAFQTRTVDTEKIRAAAVATALNGFNQDIWAQRWTKVINELLRAPRGQSEI
ncbi:glycosyltransferase family 4 protein [Sulfitobacter sp. 915]|uniref:glycosyltransferase family 4 protein n=1 Tax=Sulfitobacter sp. 915 TaxID=3368558 RepID=UPI0037468D79